MEEYTVNFLADVDDKSRVSGGSKKKGGEDVRRISR